MLSSIEDSDHIGIGIEHVQDIVRYTRRWLALHVKQESKDIF